MDSKQRGAEKKQLSVLKNNVQFISAFTQLMVNGKSLSEKEKEYLLSCAILFFRHYDRDKRFLNYFKLGYYIVMKYALLFDDVKPLYDISLQIGFYPISDFIVRQRLLEPDFINEALVNSSITRKYVGVEKYVETLEQNVSSKAILQGLDRNVAYIAPTSYGKSSIIKNVIKNNDFARIGIIVPTKSLLIQTYNDIRSLDLNYKLILHDDMYSQDPRFIGILTQERATRMIVKHQVKFDILFIDEAHSLLERDSRSYILSRLIQLNNLKNPRQKLVYLSPLIGDTNNLHLIRSGESSIFTRRIRHDFKVTELFLYDNLSSYAYDKFTGEFFDLQHPATFYDYIIANSKEKNFIYHHRPKKTEDLSIALSQKLPTLELDIELQKVVRTLKEEVHSSFYLVPLIEKGIVYLHGKIPNVVKEYLEYKFKSLPQLTYIVANSVILEGINLPIDTLFVTSTYGLHGKELTNLIGRVNRLNYVFKKDNLSLLISKIHFLNSSEFQGPDDIRNKMKDLRDHSFDDKIENPLLINYDLEKLSLTNDQKNLRRLENERVLSATETLLANDESDSKQALKKYFVENAIDDFYTNLDLAIDVISSRISQMNFRTDQKIVDIISHVFILGSEGNIKDFEIERLKNQKAINYYSNFLEVIQKQALREKITSTFKYFQTKAESDDPQLYIGKSYGEEIRYSNKYNSKEYISRVYVNLHGKPDATLVNWAIVKIKMEEDFVSFKLNKLINFLFDYQLIPEDYYLNYVYGTVDNRLIELIKFGLNVSIVKKLEKDDQLDNLSFDRNGNLVSNYTFLHYLTMQSELFQFELRKYLGIV